MLTRFPVRMSTLAVVWTAMLLESSVLFSQVPSSNVSVKGVIYEAHAYGDFSWMRNRPEFNDGFLFSMITKSSFWSIYNTLTIQMAAVVETPDFVLGNARCSLAPPEFRRDQMELVMML